MKSRIVAALICLAVLLALAAWFPVRADDNYRMAETAAAAARGDIEAGSFERAGQRLGAALKRCAPEAEGRPCRLLLHFNYAALFERWARASPERRDGYLARSADLYRRVLAEAPGHPETVNNLALVLRDLWRLDELRSLRDRLQARDPVLAARVAIVIGDGQAARGDWRSAYLAYADAAKLDPGGEIPRRKLLDAYRQPAASNTGDLLARLKDWEARFPELAADGYRTIVQVHAERDGKLVERALLRWVALVSEQRAISSAFVARQFAGVKLAPIGELQKFLLTVETIPVERAPNVMTGLGGNAEQRCIAAKGWWLDTPHRRNALAQAALALGRAAVVARDAGRAEASFVIGALCGPPSEEYVFGALNEEPFVFLDTMTELAWLQFRYPKRDPSGKKLDIVVEQLFRGKGEAYQANDLEAIQRHHVVLGQIYATKGQWSGSGARNAVFQLSRAVSVAERRAKSGDAYDPMPGLKMLLGEGYERTGDEIAAKSTYVAAAQAYLDSDDLDRTGALLERAKAIAPPASAETMSVVTKQDREIEATEKILATRRDLKLREQQIDKGATTPSRSTDPKRPIDASKTTTTPSKTKTIETKRPDDVSRTTVPERTTTPSRTPAKPDPEATWLPKESVEGVSNEFLRRQQFKVNADLAEQAKRRNDAANSERYAKEAIKSARDVTTLIGVDDVRRLERSDSIAKPVTGTPRSRIKLDYGKTPETTRGTEETTWKVTVPSVSEPLKVQLND